MKIQSFGITLNFRVAYQESECMKLSAKYFKMCSNNKYGNELCSPIVHINSLNGKMVFEGAQEKVMGRRRKGSEGSGGELLEWKMRQVKRIFEV